MQQPHENLPTPSKPEALRQAIHPQDLKTLLSDVAAIKAVVEGLKVAEDANVNMKWELQDAMAKVKADVLDAIRNVAIPAASEAAEDVGMPSELVPVAEDIVAMMEKRAKADMADEPIKKDLLIKKGTKGHPQWTNALGTKTKAWKSLLAHLTRNGLQVDGDPRSAQFTVDASKLPSAKRTESQEPSIQGASNADDENQEQ